MVLGHVVGSSVFNLLLIVGGMATWRPLPLPVSFVHFEVPAALAFALVLYPMLKGDLRISKAEGGVLVLAFVAWLLFELLVLHT
jgi:cation:H+ antiporter